MRIQLEQIRDRPLQWQESIEFTPETMGLAELVSPASVEVDGRVAVVDGGFLLTMTLRSQVLLRCDRCLDEFPSQIDNRVELLAVIDPHPESAPDVELDQRDLGLLRLDEPEVDTEPLVFDQMQLALPMSPRCREDCAGLCPQCGTNRNHDRCECEPSVDPRWQALAEL